MSTKHLETSPSAGNEIICPACWNLEYDRFDVWERFSEPDRYPAPRSRRTNRGRIAEAAQQLCPICTVLDEGMSASWGDESWEAEESEYSYDDSASDEDENDKEDSETDDETNKNSVQSLGSSDSDASGSSKSSLEGNAHKWEELPTLFQDVITLLRKLGLSYLWIDSMCIIQDDDDDWLEQSAQMAVIYSHSYLNLAAATAENSSQSLFGTRFQVFADVDASLSAQSDSDLHRDPIWWPSPKVHRERWKTCMTQPMDISAAAVLVRPP
ncbi:hypothetical protein Neosp_001642 [[Neocosmospora] mangrovei]